MLFLAPSTDFYPRPHMEGDPPILDDAYTARISTHALTWRATCAGGHRNVVGRGNFYPRPHMEGDMVLMMDCLREVDFYPRPHMEGDYCPLPICKFTRISTHALTWRATPITVPADMTYRISTHALTWRATGGIGAGITQDIISTHALTWRATGATGGDGGRHQNFYPRPHMEGDTKHAEVQACISAAYLKCSTCKAAASRRCAGLGGRVVLFHQLSRLVLGRARCEPRGEGMCDRGSHRQSGRRKGLKTHSSKMSSWLH